MGIGSPLLRIRLGSCVVPACLAAGVPGARTAFADGGLGVAGDSTSAAKAAWSRGSAVRTPSFPRSISSGPTGPRRQCSAVGFARRNPTIEKARQP